ncbi:hypothetical protein B0H11DRAFT_1912797 [Mycena galericulata]|nr:hypothetical protein B0H11DRAFT_1912797 [Mycena galericulata]
MSKRDMQKSSVDLQPSPLQHSIPDGTEQIMFTLSMVIYLLHQIQTHSKGLFYKLLPSLSALLTDVSRIESTRVAWMNVDEAEIYDILRGNIALLVFNGDVLTEFLIDRVDILCALSPNFSSNLGYYWIFESLFGIDSARRLRNFFPSVRELSQSLAAVRDTKRAWTICNSNDLSAFIFEILSQATTLSLPTIGKIETHCYRTASIRNNELILSEDRIRRLTVRKIHEQLDKHRTLWRTGITVIPRNYRLKNKAAKLHALRIAVAEHLRNMRQGLDMDGSDTLGPGSRRQSAQMLDVMEFDELESKKAGVGLGMGRLIAAPRSISLTWKGWKSRTLKGIGTREDCLQKEGRRRPSRKTNIGSEGRREGD